MNNRRGFTLIELLVTLAILGLLATVAVPTVQLVVRRQQEQDLRLALREIRGAIDRYKQAVDEGRIQKSADATGYPPTLEVLVDGVEDAKSPKKQKIYFLRRLPRDPMCRCDYREAAETWGLRSYASEPDSPQSGDDVFDVYSESTERGLNGVPYREW